ncbi:MAG: 3-phosphoshikimate 1-carboxyvinyltransferase [Candidatus Omnitrophota bacterium]
MKSILIKKAPKGLRADLAFPGDKSLTHRAIIFGALAEGVSSFTNVLSGEDCVCTRKAFESMGVRMDIASPAKLTIHGKGLHALKPPKSELYLGNSGTSLRLLLGVLAGQPFEATLTGDPSLSQRPMRRVTDHLREMGAHVEGRDGANFAPLKIRGGNLKGIDAKLPVPSAQVKSAILLAGLYAEGRTSVTEPVKSRDHTERFLRHFGVRIEETGTAVSVKGGQALKAGSFEIPGDISSAAFFIAMALLVPGSEIRFRNVLWNPTRTGIVEVLKRMGADVRVEKLRTEGPEPAADFALKFQKLKAFEIKKEELPSLIDEIPILAVLATQAEGTSVIHDADELRVKETDRIVSMTKGLTGMGAGINVEGNTLLIKGPAPLRGAEVDSFKDHRTAMSLIAAGLVAEGETRVNDIDCISTSFPEFFDLLARSGAAYQRIDTHGGR